MGARISVIDGFYEIHLFYRFIVIDGTAKVTGIVRLQDLRDCYYLIIMLSASGISSTVAFFDLDFGIDKFFDYLATCYFGKRVKRALLILDRDE